MAFFKIICMAVLWPPLAQYTQKDTQKHALKKVKVKEWGYTSKVI